MPAATRLASRPGPALEPRHRDKAFATRWLLGIPLVVLGVLALTWKENRPIGPGALLTGLGQVTGLAAAVFALCTVALMARVPVVTDQLGADRAVIWHRVAATLTMLLLAVHVPAVVWGYAAADSSSVVAESGTLLSSYPDMITATVGFVLLVAISVSSIRWVKQRMRYERWLFGHWYAYPAVALAFGHQLSTGASFVGASAPTLAWTWLNLVVATLVLWYRVILPGHHMLVRPLRVVAVQDAGGGAVHIWLQGSRLAAFRPEAGQHIRVRFLDHEGWWQSHPFSLSAAPHPDAWRITVDSSGDHSRALARVEPGTRVLVSGVYGAMTTELRRSDAVLLLGGGSGITPLRALLEAFPAGIDVRILYRARSVEDLIMPDELDALAAERGSSVDYLLGERRRDPAADVLSAGSLRRHVPDIASRDVYVCGHDSFVDAVVRSLRTLDVPAASTHTERFDP